MHTVLLYSNIFYYTITHVTCTALMFLVVPLIKKCSKNYNKYAPLSLTFVIDEIENKSTSSQTKYDF